MKNLFKLFILGLFVITSTPVFTQTEIPVMEEGFENGFPSASYWSLGTASCGYPWTISSVNYHTGSHSIYFPSYTASSGCYQSMYTPMWTFLNVQPDDSIKLMFYLYRGSTYSSYYDRLEVRLLDSTGSQKFNTVTLYRYYGLPPAIPSSGWVGYYWKIKSNDINSGNRVKFAFEFRGISDNGDNIYIDDVKISKINSKPAKSLTLRKPNGGEIINLGSNYNITWTNNNVNLLKIEFTIDGVNWNTIATNVIAPTQSYSWAVPVSSTIASKSCKVRISDMSDQSVNDESNAYFELKSQKSISLIKPNGTENIPSQKNYDITWTHINITDLKIEFSIDGGITWNSIVSSISASTQKYTWMVPTIVSNSCKVRLTDVSDPNTKEESDQYFSIYNGVSIEENYSSNSLYIYPNPATTEITILNLNNNEIISIYDVSGKLLIQKTAITPNEKIDITNLSNGIYSLKVSNNKMTQTHILIKQ